MMEFAPTVLEGESVRPGIHGGWIWRCWCGFEARCLEDVGGHRAWHRERGEKAPKRPVDLVPSLDAPDAPDPVCRCCGAPRELRRGRRVGVITLGMLPKSQNEREGLLFAARKRPGIAFVIRDEAKQVYAAIAEAAEQLDDPAIGARIVEIVFVKGPRSTSRDDPGNRMVRSKAVLDGLVHAGLLLDDTDEFLVLPPARERKAADGPKTIIHIYETERQS